MRVNLTRKTKLIFNTTGGLNDLIQKLIQMFQFTRFKNVKIMLGTSYEV